MTQVGSILTNSDIQCHVGRNEFLIKHYTIQLKLITQRDSVNLQPNKFSQLTDAFIAFGTGIQLS